MDPICILTDSAAQFTQPGFAGREIVRLIPYRTRLNGRIYEDGEGPRSTTLPASAGDILNPGLIVPDLGHLQQIFQNLAIQYHEIVGIFTSGELTPLFSQVEIAAVSVLGQANVTLIDSHSAALGLGMIVQAAAEAAARGLRAFEIERSVRRMIPRTYALFAGTGLSYMYHAGFIDEGQAIIGEMLGVLPIFSLEEGKLSAIEKARNPRGVLEFFQEFLGEFDDLQQIAFLQGAAPFNHEAHLLREHAQTHFPRTPFSEHTLNLPTALLFGPRTLGLVLLESE